MPEVLTARELEALVKIVEKTVYTYVSNAESIPMSIMLPAISGHFVKR